MPCVPIRYLICLMLCFIGIISILNRQNVNIAIVSMVQAANDTAERPNVCASLAMQYENENTCEEAAPEQPNASWILHVSPVIIRNYLPSEELTGERYDWSPELQGVLMGSFFWTYFICQTPSGYISGRFGGYAPICLSLLVSGIISIAIPFVIPVSVYIFIALRVVLGIFQSAIFPGLFVLACSWVPLHERSTAIAMNDIGPNLGNLIILFSSGFLINAFTWKIMFWLPGALSLVAFVAVILFLRNTPESHSFVSETELDHIRGRDKNAEMRRGSESNSHAVQFEESLTNTTTRESIPWKKILTNKSVWAMLVFKFFRAFLAYLVASEMPTYLGTVLHEDAVSIGIICSIYAAIHAVMALVGARVSETLIVKGIFSRTNGRKFFSLLSGTTSAILLTLIPIVGCNRDAARAIFVASGFFMACGTATDSSLPAEMSTKFHAMLFAIGNVAASSPGFLAPMCTGLVLELVQDQLTAWTIVFFSIGGLLVCANVYFLIFASAKRQDFDLTPLERRASRRLSSLSLNDRKAKH